MNDERTSEDKTNKNKEPVNVYSNNGPYIFKLDDSCLTYIFSFLPIPERVRVQRVCKRWQRAGSLPWWDLKKLDIGDKYDGFLNKTLKCNKLSLSTLRKLLRLCGPCLNHIELAELNASISNKRLLILVKKMCPNLKSIDFGITLTRKTMKYVEDNFNNIRECTIRNCWKDCEHMISIFLSNNKKLQSFSLHKSDYIEGRCIESLPIESIKSIKIVGCKKLLPKHLNKVLENCDGLETFIIESNKKFIANMNDILKLAPIQLKLKTLKISLLSKSVPYRNIVHLTFINKLTNLQTLELWGEHTLHNETLMMVGKYCKELRRAIFGWSNRVKVVGLKYIANLPKLDYLELHRMDRINNKIFPFLLALKSVICKQCNRLENSGFLFLIQMSKNLEYLNVSDCELVVEHTLVKDAYQMNKIRVNAKTLKLSITNNELILLS